MRRAVVCFAVMVSVSAAWQPSSPIAWPGASRFGALFDPLTEFPYDPPNLLPAGVRPLLISLPGLDGHPLTAFAQFPALGSEYDVRAWWPDRSKAEVGGKHDALVEAMCDFVEEQSSFRKGGIYVMGESFGGVQALALAQRLRQRARSADESPRSSPLRGVVLVNPATSFPRTDLPERAEQMQTMPAWRFYLESINLFATRGGDPQQLQTILSTLLDNPLDDPDRTPPALAEYFKRAIPAFAEGFGAPRDFFLARLSSLGPAAEAVNAALEAEGAASFGGVPLLVVAGTADKLALSVTEAPRLQKLVGPQACTTYMVEGAGHAGTLDDRIDLLAVMREWRELSKIEV
jgi:pimeloyl-ACP methyl ester carboxylesterase